MGISISILSNIIKDKITVASIPNGTYSDNIIKAAADCKIREIYTSIPTIRINKIYNVEVMGRFAIRNTDTINDCLQILTSKAKRFNILLKYIILTSVKWILGGKYHKLRRIILDK